MSTVRQLLLDDSFKFKSEHGGEYSIGKRKGKRPFSRKKSMHLTLKSSKAIGQWSLLNFRKPIEKMIQRAAKRRDVRVYDLANSGNHIHLLFRAKEKREFQNFLREISSKIAKQVTGARKGRASGRFFDLLAFTRVIEWGKAFQIVKSYLLQNRLETAGSIPYKERRTRPIIRPPLESKWVP